MATKPPRNVKDRIAWFLKDSNGPQNSGMCAKRTWMSLGGDYGNPPAWGCADANAAYDKIIKSGRFWRGTPKKGAVVAWKYSKHGHLALSYDGASKIATTDPADGSVAGVQDINFPTKWGAKKDSWIWTDQYNGVRFAVGDTSAATPGKEDEVTKADIEAIAKAVNKTLGDWVASGAVSSAAPDPKNPEAASTKIRQIEAKVDRIESNIAILLKQIK